MRMIYLYISKFNLYSLKYLNKTKIVKVKIIYYYNLKYKVTKQNKQQKTF